MSLHTIVAFNKVIGDIEQLHVISFYKIKVIKPTVAGNINV
jgi:hypothetical protein